MLRIATRDVVGEGFYRLRDIHTGLVLSIWTIFREACILDTIILLVPKSDLALRLSLRLEKKI